MVGMCMVGGHVWQGGHVWLGGCAWQGVCMAEEGCVWQRGACIAGCIHGWDVHGRGTCVAGRACVVGGVCMAGGVHGRGGVCVAEGGMHSRLHSCLGCAW